MIKKSIRAEKIKELKGSADRWHKYPNCKDYNEVASGNMRIIFHSDGTYEMYISDPGSLFPVNQIYRLGEWYIVRENTITVITHSAQTGIPGYTIPPQTFTFDSDGNVSYENNFYELCD